MANKVNTLFQCDLCSFASTSPQGLITHTTSMHDKTITELVNGKWEEKQNG